MNGNVIACSEVVKTFGRKKALDALSLNMPEGSVFALLGNNGAGKSTLVKMIAGRLLPDSGTIGVLGENPACDNPSFREKTAFVFEAQKLFDELTLLEYGTFLGSFHREWSSETFQTLLRRFRLPREGKLGSFSRGMYSKASLAGALSRRPELLILDDPTLGLDTSSRREFMDILTESVGEYARSILITGHILPELEGLCDAVGILRNGRNVLAGNIDDLKQHHALFSFAAGPPLPVLEGEVKRRTRSDALELFSNAPEATERGLRENGIISFRRGGLTLEELFILYA